MFDWIPVYLVFFFFIGLFQFMIGFFDPPEIEKNSNLIYTQRDFMKKEILVAIDGY